jgi:exonuclease III
MSHARQHSLKRDLRIVGWNANGPAARHEEHCEFLARHKPDVLLLAETHLNPHRQVRLPNPVVQGLWVFRSEQS